MPTSTLMSTKRQNYKLSPCLLSTVLAHRQGAELICSSWSSLGTSQHSVVQVMDLGKNHSRVRATLVADDMTKGLSQGAAAALEKQGYHHKNEVRELESSLEDVARQGQQVLRHCLWVEGRWVLAHACGLSEPGDAAAAPDSSPNSSNNQWYWIVLVLVLAAAVTDGNIQANCIWDPFIQIL